MKTTKKDYKSIGKWVDEMPKRGLFFFSYTDVLSNFVEYSPEYVNVALQRLKDNGIIVAPSKGFYVVVPTEYALKGAVPPMFFIDAMMKHLHSDYYVCLLNAAAIYGAAHQQPQTFSVMITGLPRRDIVEGDTKINFYNKNKLSSSGIQAVKTKTGYCQVSTPEQTALDLVAYEKAVGGINRVATVLYDLVEQIDFSDKEQLLADVSAPVLQRLGFLFERYTDFPEKAEPIYSFLTSNRRLRKIGLKASAKTDGCKLDDKWKLYENIIIEIDE